jgi:hypothetical protein
MAYKQRYISTSFWDDQFIQTCSRDQKLFYLYMLTNPLTNIAGVYQISDRRICFDTGFTEKELTALWDFFSGEGKIFRKDGWIVLPTWPRHQKWKQRSLIKTGIENELRTVPISVLCDLQAMGYQYPIDTILKDIDTTSKDIRPYGYESNYLDRDREGDQDSELDPNPDRDTEGKEINSDFEVVEDSDGSVKADPPESFQRLASNMKRGRTNRGANDDRDQ